MCSEHGESTHVFHIIQDLRVQITGLLFVMEEENVFAKIRLTRMSFVLCETHNRTQN
jgi:hypothetical protein